jgi:hypothetical protein
MTTPASPASQKAWAMIETEKRRDRFIRRVSIVAWSVTFTIVLMFAALSMPGFLQMFNAARAGDLPWITVIGTAMPVVHSLLILSILVAVLSTVGVFLRFRSASLTEIQVRLAALEDMLATQGVPNETRS